MAPYSPQRQPPLQIYLVCILAYLLFIVFSSSSFWMVFVMYTLPFRLLFSLALPSGCALILLELVNSTTGPIIYVDMLSCLVAGGMLTDLVFCYKLWCLPVWAGRSVFAQPWVQSTRVYSIMMHYYDPKLVGWYSHTLHYLLKLVQSVQQYIATTWYDPVRRVRTSRHDLTTHVVCSCLDIVLNEDLHSWVPPGMSMKEDTKDTEGISGIMGDDHQKFV